MRETTLRDQPVLVLREPTPVKPAPHRCPVSHGDAAATVDSGAIIQCECGKRYRCRLRHDSYDECIWVRRLLPWPPRDKNWPSTSTKDQP